MAKRSKQENFAIVLYADGHSIEEIAESLDVSATSLYKWKNQSLVPGAEMDEWDRARLQKRSYSMRTKALFERELKAAEDLPPGALSAPAVDQLSKLGAMAKRWDDVERAEAASREVKVEVDRPAVFLENMEWLATKLRDLDPEGLRVLARNFDTLIIAFKAEHATAS